MARRGSWKYELDTKYNRLMNMGSISVIDRANTAILKAIEELDQIQKEIDAQGHPYNLRKFQNDPLSNTIKGKEYERG